MTVAPGLKTYKRDRVSLQHNRKTGEAGTIDIYRGCPGCEMKNAPCYAAKGAKRVGIDFFQPVRREFDKRLLEKQLERYQIDWVRIGCISDPSLDWNLTCRIVELAAKHGKESAVISKIYNAPTRKQLEDLASHGANLQISVCGLTPSKDLVRRKKTATLSVEHGLSISMRVNSAVWLPRTKPELTQANLVLFAEDMGMPLIDTPIRLFQTSPFWKHVDQSKYHRHISPISGKPDNQRTAGLIIPGAYPCYSTCAEGPSGNDPVGCPHQCLTKI